MPNAHLPNDFKEMSATLGRIPRHIQGAGGNTSLKHKGVMWVKASGACLSDALLKKIFVPLDIDRLRGAMEAAPTDPSACVLGYSGESALRPSIETVLHALLPHRVVVHTHSIAAIAATVRQDAEAFVSKRLSGLSWRFVPYTRPGESLMRTIQHRLAGAEADILILANHGLVVGAESCVKAMDLLAEIERRLSDIPRPLPTPDFERLSSLAAGSEYHAPADIAPHRIGADPVALKIACGGSLYPDHVVFLGRGVDLLEAPRPPSGEEAPPLLVVPGAGVLIRNDASSAVTAMISCLADVLAELPTEGEVSYLSSFEESELLNWEAEHFRRRHTLATTA
jgi:rhamnose utilization protein RhaD (predicted bifunctional aldolase and dehydrogenase)